MEVRNHVESLSCYQTLDHFFVSLIIEQCYKLCLFSSSKGNHRKMEGSALNHWCCWGALWARFGPHCSSSLKRSSCSFKGSKIYRSDVAYIPYSEKVQWWSVESPTESASPLGAEQKAGKITSSVLKLTVLFQPRIKPKKYLEIVFVM